MKREIIASEKAPAAVGTYSQAVKASFMADGKEHFTLYVSGQLPIDRNTGEFAQGGVAEQLAQIFKNIGYILEEAGCSFADVAKTTVYLTDMADFGTLNQVYAQFFTEPYPARVAFAVKELPKKALAEVDVIAVK
ncbi:MAG: reactive intermediate/imine deaminase [Bacteroidales bacterium]|nr:reactive intermediate/imine deaminase [Bacteroidales bacterium]